MFFDKSLTGKTIDYIKIMTLLLTMSFPSKAIGMLNGFYGKYNWEKTWPLRSLLSSLSLRR